MVLNPAKASATRARFDILHELAHGTLHRTGIPMDHAVKEDQADYFAGAALLPKRSFAREFWGLGRRRDWEGFFDLKAKWGASVVAIVVRAYQLGLMDAAEYRRRCKDMSKRGWFRSPEPAERDAEKPELFHIVLRRFQEETGKTITSIVADLKWTPALWTDVTGVSPPSPEGPTVTSFEEFRQRRLTLEQ
jgi:Zn-dependent peptidase ImmA (M78 family)